ncbi:hypothetical protein CLAFUW4_08127 [Fulvia fulva]|uniref:Uncharacterized protein n=1 Tax=Passalora fulva TaxID=5499 RepID=A0A9Q8P6F5_PASFU|nr:uncharacterized protein CLAFUR5_08242 [Fulvia fulva]KAK4629541.1 hypothetical protein CLAFUR4_08132 [Fulvia fulva]KAK4630529.1 hypothetical protein CLAFUR0_08127 [Fulvia fulva]UJO14983.1 hypothetical protein CLAFUR5_08242 [Fulvia fulva]WPV12189.1 hypothetical protein CLAFUW4_08127 [Fulvia fulva]WPV27913.1 hypothetical protein CLAFUW7_08127 [Fulvia fulva]
MTGISPIRAETLRPYIRTRQEANAIRKNLQATLPVSPLGLALPRNPDDIDTSSLSGVRKAYGKALEAHKQAQARYDALKTELEEIVHRDPNEATNPDEGNVSLTESYLPLMRQKEKRRRLKVIEKSLARIESQGDDTTNQSLDKVARRQVGEPPAPPSTSGFADREADFSAEYDLTQLKKAILNVKNQLEEHKASTEQLNGVNGEAHDPQAELRGLQKAHNELTAWMEQQLALISDVGAAKDRSDASSTKSGQNGDSAHDMMEIESLYELYLGARQRLLDVVAHPPSSVSPPSSPPDFARRGSDSGLPETRSTTSETLLPFIATLTAAKQQEQQLLQQTAYTRRQFASAEAQDQALLSRLADESHLMQHDLRRGAPRGRDWAEAAASAGAATTEEVNKRLRSGHVAVDGAAKSLRAIKDMPNSFDDLVG